MGCKSATSSTTFNFVSAQAANGVLISDLVDIIPLCSLGLETPTSFVLSNPGNTTIDASVTSNSNGQETGFQWQISTNINFIPVTQSIITGNNVTNTQFTGLLGGTLYYARCRAIGALNSPFSNVDSAMTIYDFLLALNFKSSGSNYVSVPDLSVVPSYPLSFSWWQKYDEPFLITDSREVFSSMADASNAITIRMRSPINGVYSMNFITWNNTNGGSLTTTAFDGGLDVNDLNVWLNWGVTIEESPSDTSKVRIKMYNRGLPINVVGGDPYAEIPKTEILPTMYSFSSIGRTNAENTRFFDGDIDSFAIIKKTLSASEISSIWGGGTGSSYLDNLNSSIVHAFYKFDKAGAVGGGDNTALDNSCVDSSGNSNTATAVNFTKNGATSNWVESKSL